MNETRVFTKRLVSYSAAGAAFALSAGSAQAGIVFTNTTQSFDIRSSQFVDIDFNGDATPEFRITGFFSSFTTTSPGATFDYGAVRLFRNGAFAHLEDGAASGGTLPSDPNALPVGFLIGPGGNFDVIQNNDTIAGTYNGAHMTTGGNFPFFADQIRYIGVRFNLGGGDLYGWIALRINSSDLLTGDVLGWAYEDTGAAIAAGATTGAPVPEPSSLTLLAAGAAGLAALRRRRKN